MLVNDIVANTLKIMMTQLLLQITFILQQVAFLIGVLVAIKMEFSALIVISAASNI